MRNTLLTLAAICFFAANTHAVDEISFDRNFADSTLRVNYIFSGDATTQEISLSEISLHEMWAGRRHNLDSLPLKGNGRIDVRDHKTGKTIYRHSFSDLFLEWLATDEARDNRRAMEATMLIPYPRATVEINVTLDNSAGQPAASFSHLIDPRDILIRHKEVKSKPQFKYIHKSGSPREKIDVAILAEGYTREEIDSFYVHARRAVESILSHEPFRSLSDRFNFVAVATESEDSGVSIPRLKDWKNTAFSSNFSTFYSDRYLTTSRVHAIHEKLSGIPYEHLIILANTDEYGGGGIYNSYTLTTSRHKNFRPVVTHEFGHSFAGLADEYFYTDDVMTDTYATHSEPWEQNVTTLVDFSSKWADMLPDDSPVPSVSVDNAKVGVYEGAAYSTRGVFRPFDRCRMRDNEYPSFCPVCQRAIRKIIEFYVSDQ